ncbi:MAG: nitroreductase family protein [Bacteroidales bacterium]|nr:nitroreductase family protein [Bacteroidales bacterium]MBR0452631.1 nitroreductase family protein [Bacteroidales bacterium]
MLEFMKNRATLRQYREKPVSEELLNELLDIACRASNTGNMQLYSIVVTRDAAGKQALAPAHFNQPQVTNAPVVLTFCADLNRYTKWCLQRDAHPGFDNIQSLAYAAIDAVIASQAFCTAAEANGLGICYLGTTTYNADKIIDVLQLPSLVMPIVTISLGYPAAEPSPCERLPLPAILHQEHYHDYSSDDIDKLFFEKENLPANKHYVEINNKQTLAQVFTDIRYTKKDNEFFSGTFIETLKKQGFLKLV